MTMTLDPQPDSGNPQDGSGSASPALVTALVAALGDDAVTADPERLLEFADPYRPALERRGPLLLVQPTRTEGVQAVLRIAAEHGVPVGVSSQGRNFGYGGGEPVVGGSIALNLRRMNRVLEVNDELGYAVVEPGVTFQQLYDTLRDGGHPYWISTPDLSWGSVIGNACDHGVGYTKFGEHAAALVGMEVVLPTGDVIRTGMGAIETPDGSASSLWHVQRQPYGPTLEGLFTQSNFGVITRAGVWLMPQPEVAAVAAVIVPREDDLVPLIDALRPLMMDGTIDNYPLIQHGHGIIALTMPPEAWPRPGYGPADQIEGMLAEMGLGAWILGRVGLYGSREVVEAKKARLENAFAHIPGMRIQVNLYEPPYDKAAVPQPDQHALGITGMDIIHALDPWGGEGRGGHVDFSPATPMTGRAAMAVHRLTGEVYARHDVKSITAVIPRDRSLLHVNMIMFDTENPTEEAAAHAAVRELIPAAQVMGYGEYRSHPDHSAAVVSGYRHSDGALHRFLGTIKDALDPAGILAPGRHGIWPSAGPATAPATVTTHEENR